MDKTCVYCGKKLVRKLWLGKKVCQETNKRWNERKFCDNTCRSKHLSITGKGENNYFYGKHLIPHNMRFEAIIKVKTGKGYIQLRYFDTNGERKVKYEHRDVMERVLGRQLRVEEVVHHKDQNVENNSTDNLMVFDSDLEHRKFHKYILN
jgi:hypothetical protein